MRTIVVLLLCFQFQAWSQTFNSNYRDKRLKANDSIVLDTVAINSSYFKVYSLSGELINKDLYKVDFEKATLYLNELFENDSVRVSYLKYPRFLTKKYYNINPSVIVPSNSATKKYYSFSEETKSKTTPIPFDGINSSGSLSRGITVGNNQNAVLNSELDLQISGKINDKVTLRASIQDANIPLQESGYSQQLDEFDQVFIEMFTDQWQIRGGDIDLVQNQTFFSNFSKRVQGISLKADLKDGDTGTKVFAAGAIVRGQFTTSRFNGQEGNQGPYKLKGPNGELYVLIVSGSETVYVNGIIVERGEGKDYIIDYNAGEIIFNATYPITSEMRITVDYQFSERNYTRYNALGGASYESEEFKVGVSVYSESDAKNQPLIQNLSNEQKEILAEAGNDETQMYAPSAVLDSYSENKILYRKAISGGQEYFEFSNNPNDELYRVTFSLIGPNKGNYVIRDTNAVQVIYEYSPPVNGLPTGAYEPLVKLIAPEKLQVAVLNTNFSPNEKTEITAEVAASKNDLNLFSNIDNENNDGWAATLGFKQRIIKNIKIGEFNVYGKTDFINKDFNTIQRLYNAEFNRDWNLVTPEGNQLLSATGLEYKTNSNSRVAYQFDHLNFSENFNGNKHNLLANLRFKNVVFESKSSTLKNNSQLSTSEFQRTFNKINFGIKNKWIGSKYAAESSIEKIKESDSLTGLSQRFNSLEIFSGVGDSTKVYVELGYRYRVNDSVRMNRVQKVNHSNNYFMKSQLLKSVKSNLSLYLNYRQLKYTEGQADENALNSRVSYGQQFWNNKIQWNTLFETNSGSLALQDFTYVEVEPGQGKYVWIDYNANGIQDLDEFEIAQFQDQGKFVRVLLPHQTFVKTNQKKLSQTLIINPEDWRSSQKKNRKFWSHFYNQLTYVIDRKNRSNSNRLDINPFESFGDQELALMKSLRNTLFFNRAKQRYTTSYTILKNSTRYFLSTGIQENNNRTNQLNFVHNIKNIWLINFEAQHVLNESLNANFTYRNYFLEEVHLKPKLSFLLDEYIKFDVFYKSINKSNSLGANENLEQHNLGVSFAINHPKKGAINGTFDYFDNIFEGNSNTPVAYQMLGGLQPGKNFTWSLYAQKKILSYLDLNLNYSGRATNSSDTIHTGSIQLKAYF